MSEILSLTAKLDCYFTENVSMNDTLAVRLLLSRRDLRINQDEVADRAGVSRTYISDLERGKVDNPTVDVIIALARVLQVRPEYLLGWSDDALGEDLPANVAEGRLVYEANTPRERRLIQEALDILGGLSTERQDLALRLLEELNNAQRVRIVGSE